MRRAVITIDWDGPDKAVREVIDEAVDNLFFDLSMGGKVTAATSSIDFTARVKPLPGTPQ